MVTGAEQAQAAKEAGEMPARPNTMLYLPITRDTGLENVRKFRVVEAQEQ